MKQFSANLLLRHLYNETEPTENAAIAEAFSINYKLKEEYDSWKEIKRSLNETRLTAPKHIVKAVLQHSKNYF